MNTVAKNGRVHHGIDHRESEGAALGQTGVVFLFALRRGSPHRVVALFQTRAFKSQISLTVTGGDREIGRAHV